MYRFLATAMAVLPVLLIQYAQAQDGAEGKALYSQFCASCHGTDLTGGLGSNLADGEWTHADTRDAQAQIVRAGLPDLGMPSFGETLTAAQIDALLEFVHEAGDHPGSIAKPDARSLETLDYMIRAETFADGLDTPWAIDFVDRGTALITERPGRLRIVRDGKLEREPVAGTPEVLSEGQGGLLDVAVDPNYADNGWIYLSFSHALPKSGGKVLAMTKVVRGRLDGNRWTDEDVIFEAQHDQYLPTRHHYGSRIVFDGEGNLFFSIGERGSGDHAQDLSRPNGKIHRVRTDGSIPPDNPFVGTPGALPSIYAYGTRNAQGLVYDSDAKILWAVEHGPKGGDELNHIEAGKNYGWPVITYGINYNGTTITAERHREGMEQPVFYWRPSIAVSGVEQYHGDLFKRWEGKLIVGALAGEVVRLLQVEEGRVMHEETILEGEGRVREAVVGPDGAIYVVLNEPDEVWRLVPTKDRIADGL